ncbi:hypothetical protein BKA66DRAFT_425700 [Pyrenochaeta sp. MPI-SDFR-AT-0127]|nr:hypothetical protein BKA66DRAFT_425700 [Pyrenochaeta sp. MPI-SDFR-AT-0127]
MCRIEERIYVNANGHRSKFEEAFPCDKSRGGKLCSKVKRRTSEYHPKNGAMSRDDTPSPINPPTPTGAGTYLTQPRRPSGSGSRPSTRDGQKVIKPEIIIEFGPKNSKSTKYPSVSVSTGSYKRSSLGASSIGSNDVAIESPGSDASHTVRTGFPEAPLPPSVAFGRSDNYIATPTVPQGRHHRHTSSSSSFTGSSRTPSLYVTSDPDYDSPTNQRTARYSSTVVHNHTTANVPPSPSRSQPGISAGSYRTAVVTPHGFTQETHTPDGLYPLDYSEFADQSASSHASSGAPEITRRGKDRDERRKKKEEDRRLQEELDRKAAEELEKAENIKQVRFELGRAEGRAQERAQKVYAETEKARAEAREEARKRKEEERKSEERKLKEREEQVRKRKEERSKPPTNDFTKRPTGTRRLSMTQTQIEDQRRLLAAEEIRMQGEREAAEAREREERSAAFRQQQEQPGYYDPRGGDRTLSNNNSTLARRNSISRRNSVSATAPPTGLGRSNSNRRPSIIQPNPPVVSTQASQSYGRPSARQSGPPVSFPAKFNHSARRPSFSQENPFAAPPTRGSGSSLDNPFSPTTSVMSSSSTGPAPDPWDVRVIQDALPATDSRYTIKQRGEAVINRSATHNAARQATRAMGRAAGYDDDYDDESEEDHVPRYATRTGLSGKGRKKH